MPKAVLSILAMLLLTACVLTEGSGGPIRFSGDGHVVSYAGSEGETALTTLRALTAVITQASPHGEFVVSISGVSASANEFWAFLVNGQMSSQGAGVYKAGPGDLIEWRLQGAAP